MERIEQDEWTPKDVGEELIRAVQWANRTGGRVGPAGYGSGMPQIMMTQMERLAEQWPLLDDMDAQPMRRGYSPGDVSQMERILIWQTTYLSDSPVVANALCVWLFCKIKRGARYGKVIDAMGGSRATAYRQRDRALALIATGLTRDGIARGRH